MFVFGAKRPAFRPVRWRQAPASPAASSSASSRASARPAGERASAPPEGRRFELLLLVAGLPAAAREESIQRLLPLVEKRPAWSEEDVGDEPAEKCRCWWPFAEERLHRQTPRGLLLMLQTEVESGLRSAATPLWLLNRIVGRVWLLHQGQRIGQVYRELERQLGDAALALAWVRQMLGGLARVGILKDEGR
jgi:hypothetical protein